MKAALAVACALFAACVEGRREHIQVHEATRGYPEDVGADLAATLSKLYETFSSRTSKTAADSIVFNINRLAKNAQYGDGSKMNHDGWVLMLDQIGLAPDENSDHEKIAMEEAWTYLSEGVGSISPFTASQKITNGKMSQAREDVLKSIFTAVTGSLSNTMVEGQLDCASSPGALIGEMGGNPVTFAKFKAYYNHLGMFLANDGQFVLMLVNAWHHMKSPYDQINTVNLRVRCYKDGADDTGAYIALIDDCHGESIEAAVEAQTGTKYERCEKHE